MKALLVGVVLAACVAPIHAQQPVQPWADVTSYATAAVNPTIAAVKAWRSNDRACRFGQLALSEAIGNGVALTVKHFVRSERPCLGCAPDGMPSGHSMNGAIGAFASGGWGLAFSVPTPGLRVVAHRHTPRQVLTGTLLGLGADAAGHLLRCRD